MILGFAFLFKREGLNNCVFFMRLLLLGLCFGSNLSLITVGEREGKCLLGNFVLGRDDGELQSYWTLLSAK
jgi:hypothetical protein